MLLKNHIVIIAEKNVKSHIRFLLMLMKKPSSVGDHRHLTGYPLFSRHPGKQFRHVIYVGMAVPDK